jgi:hypothetical protein
VPGSPADTLTEVEDHVLPSLVVYSTWFRPPATQAEEVGHEMPPRSLIDGSGSAGQVLPRQSFE